LLNIFNYVKNSFFGLKSSRNYHQKKSYLIF